MKKIILLLAVIVCGFALQAQTVSFAIPRGDTYKEVTTDYVLTNTLGRTFKWAVQMDWPTTQDFIVHLDSTSGNHTNVAVSLYGQKSAILNDSTLIGSTVNWKGSSADTTIVISNTTENRYRTFFSVFKGTGTGTSTITVQALKLWNSGE